ncbi:MAG TPA: 4-hydroxybenzoate octaprenyltransferase [Alphaproteobacteria bacterium]|nr:4-hydroxybenzoate octaprenyltransferase [Alphaproteobacteria bacterium]USO05380.1 MAG: 4-hydroxybenzoate octaprenyltransferase [Rhodospirillales bacterium]HOO81308.1 4-hydroxybenzoate octaprenyltransferase [Alphaproteobacteria bacterium]
MFTDIRLWNWIEKLPERFRPYVYLARLDRPIGIWLLLLPALWGITLAASHLSGFSFKVLWLIFLFALGASVMRAAGCVVNDIWDRKLDAQVDRTRVRPLASGEVSVQQALIFLFGLLMAGFCILILMNGITILLGLLAVPLIVIYPLMKRVTFWPQAVLGLTFNFGALMGWAAVMDGLSAQALLLYVAACLWTLGYDTIYAHQDKEDDALIGVKSTALKFGENSKKWVSGFYAVMLVFLGWGFALSSLNAFALPGLALIGMHLFWQIGRWDMDDPACSLAVFKSNRDLGLLVLAVIFAGGF